MLLYGKYYLLFDKAFDFNEKLKRIDEVTLKVANELIYELFDSDKMSTAVLCPKIEK